MAQSAAWPSWAWAPRVLLAGLLAGALWLPQPAAPQSQNNPKPGTAAPEISAAEAYRKGWDVYDDDYAEMARWFRKAADQGYSVAQYEVGVMYEEGQGVPRDLDQARAWMQKAAGQDDGRAKKWLAAH